MKPDHKIRDYEILQPYLDKIQENKNTLVNFLERDYPSQLNGYTETMKSFMFTDMCDNYFKKIKNCKFNFSF